MSFMALKRLFYRSEHNTKQGGGGGGGAFQRIELKE